MAPAARTFCTAVLALSLSGVHCGAQESATKTVPRSAAAITDIRVNDPGVMEARSALLRRAEAELARGEVTAATDTFERAAMMLHASDTEMGLVRAYMQAGQYRRALAFCSHVAGVHLESGPAGALHAWLLRAGGQDVVAQRVLQETLDRLPQDPVALDVRRAFATPAPGASGLMLRTPHRMAPQAVPEQGQPRVPESARVVSSGVLIGDGMIALVPSAAIRDETAQAIWVRNGLGQTTLARADPTQPLESLAVTVLRLDAPLVAEGAPFLAVRDPFAGSAGFAFAYSSLKTAEPAWPWLSQGFFGALQGEGGLRKLGIGLAANSYGGPVLDAGGRLAGMLLPGRADEATMLSASRWVDLIPETASTLSPAGAVARPGGVIPADLAYEQALRIALQVIVLR
ncbi:tetratricopeptide repeat protein [Variovorax sp. GT1P44]|uniref:tetratricopeptide repeat protein n=1 Tax=Variovorax sp. GT1P44 TaxID=3443742 RepID=UPI003F48E11C